MLSNLATLTTNLTQSPATLTQSPTRQVPWTVNSTYSTSLSTQRVMGNLTTLTPNLTQSPTRQMPWIASPTYSTPHSPQRVLSSLVTLSSMTPARIMTLSTASLTRMTASKATKDMLTAKMTMAAVRLELSRTSKQLRTGTTIPHKQPVPLKLDRHRLYTVLYFRMYLLASFLVLHFDKKN